jgi:5-methylthioadenosine/S-adenosylhomocysteine deaminase
LGGGSDGSDLHIAPAAIRIEGSRIAEARRLDGARYRENLARFAEETGGRPRDFRDRLISPAFVNAHTHLALGFLRGSAPPEALRGNMVRELYFAIERNLEPEDVAAFTRMGAYESLLAGVGLVWDHYYHGLAVAQGLAQTGLAGVVAPTVQDLSGPGVGWTRDQLLATERIAQSADLLDAGIAAAVGPHATDTVSEELWSEAAAIAREHELPLHAHLAQSLEEHSFSVKERHDTPVGWLASLRVLEGLPAAVFAHALYASRRDLARLDPARDVLVFCPCSQLVFGFPADPLVWEEAGLRWAVATDCSPSNDSMNLQKELRHVAGLRTAATSSSRAYRDLVEEPEQDLGTRRRGDSIEYLARVPVEGDALADAVWRERLGLFERAAEIARPESLLARVWSVPGALHPVLRAGVLEAGALANLLVWDPEHPSMWPGAGLSTLAMGDTTQAIHAMFVAGREVGQAGDFHRSLVESERYREALREADRRRGVLLAKR